MEFICEICEYKTNYGSNMEKHKKSNKHIQNEKEYKRNNTEFICMNCNRKFTNVSSLSKHKKTCSHMIDKESEIVVLKKTLENRDQLVENLKHIIDKLEDDVKYFKSLVNNTGSIVKTSMNALSYVITHYNDAPPLQPFNKFELLITEKNHTLPEIVLYNYKHKKLHQYIGDVIINEYQHDNPALQSFWNTDYSRLVYVIKLIINNKPIWEIDKGAVKIFDSLVNPILVHIKKSMNEFIQERAKDLSVKDFEEVTAEITKANNVVDLINSGELGKDVIRYITPNFYLNKTNLITE